MCFFVIMPDLPTGQAGLIRHPEGMDDRGFSMRVYARVASTGLRTAGMTEQDSSGQFYPPLAAPKATRAGLRIRDVFK
jgi:hypothetical protein